MILLKLWCENTMEGKEYLTFNGYSPICRISKKIWLVKRIGKKLDDVKIITKKLGM